MTLHKKLARSHIWWELGTQGRKKPTDSNHILLCVSLCKTMRRLSQLVSQLSVRRKRRSVVQPGEEEEEHRTPETGGGAATTDSSSPETPLTPATTTTVDADPVIPKLDDLEFSASRDLAVYLCNSELSAVKNQEEFTAFPAFEYLLPKQPADDNNSNASTNQQKEAAPLSSAKSRFKTLPKKAGHRLSIYRPKSTMSLLKKSRSTPNFAEAASWYRYPSHPSYPSIYFLIRISFIVIIIIIINFDPLLCVIIRSSLDISM